jgi:uncharacterized protein YvpB
MVLQFFKTNVTPDTLYRWLQYRGLSRHSGYDLAYCFNQHISGVVDTFSMTSSVEKVKQDIDRGMPSIIHGYFTSFGHIIVVTGYDKDGLIVNDPNGEWFSSGYRKDLSGKSLHYSYDLINRVAAYDGNLWHHTFTYAS